MSGDTGQPAGDGENSSLTEAVPGNGTKILGLRTLSKTGEKKTKTYFSPLNNIIRYKHVLSALFVSHFTHSPGATIGSEMSSDFISPGTRGLAHHLLF